MNSNAQQQAHVAGVAFPETLKRASLLNTLLNTEEHVSPPMPTIQFRPMADGQSLGYVGPVSVSQYDRLHYIALLCGMEWGIKPSLDHAEGNAFVIKLSGGDDTKLEEIALREPLRRMRGLEAQALLEKATGLPWCWDRLCLSTPYPQDGHPAHGVLEKFSAEGVTKTPYDLSVFSAPSQIGAGSWLSIHNCDLTRLRLMTQETPRLEGSVGR